MHFVDEAVIEVKSGGGGRGCVSFRREKYVPRGGPDGGDGGDGGDVYVIGNPHMSTLLDFKYRQHWSAKRGVHGSGKNKHGRNGEDLVIPVPLGTEIIDEEGGDLIVDVTCAGEKILILTGGRGGRGNARFVTSTHQVPREYDEGDPPKTARIRLVLKVIADVGIIGFPNAGKSTLISVISHAKPKIADYPFTTLTPNLGIVRLDEERSFVAADIPGIIEGASEGTGLGTRFLRHVERTKVLIHMIDMNPDTGRNPVDDYHTLNRELLSFSPLLAEKPQVIAAGKMDLTGAEERYAELQAELAVDIFPVSAMNGTGIRELLNHVFLRLERLRADETDDVL
ncbi:MAG: GTPase ObgE [Deltaproteobacteria bacterium]|nr:GTPase ObgE [Candidatus Zymogenaceae bacterium]